MKNFILLFLVACGTPPASDNKQLPPTSSATDLAKWLDAGHYKSWHCELEASAKTFGASAIHVHGVTRVCSNDTLAAGTAPWASGSAAVKEIWSGGVVTGLDAYVKTQADS